MTTNQLRALRERAGKTKAEVAAAYGSTYQAIANIEAEEGPVSLVTLLRYVDALGWDLRVEVLICDADGSYTKDAPIRLDWTDHARAVRAAKGTPKPVKKAAKPKAAKKTIYAVPRGKKEPPRLPAKRKATKTYDEEEAEDEERFQDLDDKLYFIFKAQPRTQFTLERLKKAIEAAHPKDGAVDEFLLQNVLRSRVDCDLAIQTSKKPPKWRRI